MLGQILTLLEETPKEEQKDLQFLIHLTRVQMQMDSMQERPDGTGPQGI